MVGFGLCLGLLSLAYAGEPPVTASGNYKDWERLIDVLEIVQPFKLADYGELVILPLDTSATPLPKESDNTYEPTVKSLGRTSSILISEIKEKVGSKISVLTAENDQEISKVISKQNVLVLKGKVSEMNPGSRALRYFVGFGAGKTRVEFEGELLEFPGNKPLLKFKHARVSAMGAFGGDYDKFLDDDSRDVSKDLGQMLINFK